MASANVWITEPLKNKNADIAPNVVSDVLMVLRSVSLMDVLIKLSISVFRYRSHVLSDSVIDHNRKVVERVSNNGEQRTNHRKIELQRWNRKWKIGSRFSKE